VEGLLADRFRQAGVHQTAPRRLAGPDWILELEVDAEDQVTSVTVQVFAGNEDVFPAIVGDVLAVVGGRANDLTSGRFLTGGPDDLTSWRSYCRGVHQTLRHDEG
jgi:hypothetical protein